MYDNKDFVINTADLKAGEVCFQAPSNIALVKYWGKHGNQLPNNPNVSFTLDVAKTITKLSWSKRSSINSNCEVVLYYDGVEKPAFADRIIKYFNKLNLIYPFLKQVSWRIDTHNTFPHGAGIASSASAMAAIANCLIAVEELWFTPLEPNERLRKMSYLARLGSGSASRSVYPEIAAWGESTFLYGTSNEFAIPLKDCLHPSFKRYKDSIFLVSKAEKSVSSSAGHGLMENHPYAKMRYELANKRYNEIITILKTGKLLDFCEIVEADALDLHALMMQSTPSYMLMEPATLAIIKEVKKFRSETNLPVCFTLDAGPNVHLLYPESIATKISDWIENVLLPLSPGGVIHDQMGNGPTESKL